MIKKEAVPVQLSFEPVNRRDENAILVHASLDDLWKPIGYIPGLKELPKSPRLLRTRKL